MSNNKTNGVYHRVPWCDEMAFQIYTVSKLIRKILLKGKISIVVLII